jgi:hypothetical protein
MGTVPRTDNGYTLIGKQADIALRVQKVRMIIYLPKKRRIVRRAYVNGHYAQLLHFFYVMIYLFGVSAIYYIVA